MTFCLLSVFKGEVLVVEIVGEKKTKDEKNHYRRHHLFPFIHGLFIEFKNLYI